ncbi:MAG: hypothetical protein N2505_00485 [Endomicrobia bacterium]|nr:hypothetical protein [Endomicrobiia bacterium]
MKNRPLRPAFYQEIKLLGVRMSDWKYIIIGTTVVFFSTVFLNINVKGFNISLPLAFLTLIKLISFFNFIRFRKRPLFIECYMKSLYRWILGYETNRIEGIFTSKRKNPYWIVD